MRKRTKQWASQLMCYITLFLNCEQAKVEAQGILTPVSITILVVAGAAGAVVVVSMFKPSYRCWGDPETPGTNWCSTMSMLTGRKSGLVGPGINFRSYAKCMTICTTNAPTGYTANSAPPGMLEMYVVQKSYNLYSWTSCGVLEDVGGDTDDGFYRLEYREPQENVAKCFYRVIVVYVQDPSLAKSRI